MLKNQNKTFLCTILAAFADPLLELFI